MEYTESDGLILVSVEGADKGAGADLSATQAYAAMLSGAVPPAEKLEQTLARMLQAGVLEVTAGRYRLCKAMKAELAQAIGREGKWAELPGKALRVLNALQDP